MPRLVHARILAALSLSWLLCCSAVLRAAAPTEQESNSGEYSARVTATDTKDAPGVRYPLTVTITTRVTKRTMAFPTEVSALTKWVALWDPRNDAFIFFAPQIEGWSVAFVPETKYGAFTTRPLTDDEKTLGEKSIDEKYGTRRPDNPLPIPRSAQGR